MKDCRDERNLAVVLDMKALVDAELKAVKLDDAREHFAEKKVRLMMTVSVFGERLQITVTKLGQVTVGGRE